MIQIIVILAIFIILIIIFKFVYMKYKVNDIENILKDEEYRNINNKLPNNMEMCKEILKNIDKSEVKIILNQEESTNSFYNIFNNKIVLCDNPKVNNLFGRLLYISHECHHSRQNKKFLWMNFILANINLLYFIVTGLLIITNIIPKSILFMLLVILLIINIFVLFARIVIESDATYMSLAISRNYAKKYLNDNELEKLISKYEIIISNGFSTFVFGIFISNISIILSYMLIIFIKLI